MDADAASPEGRLGSRRWSPQHPASPGMDLAVDILLLLAAIVLVQRSNSDRDDVWRLCLRALAVMAVMAVITSERGMPLAVLLLVFALCLPGVARLERSPEVPGPLVGTGRPEPRR